MEKPKVIIIIGMHRCGTSLLSSCLVENNFSIGKNVNKDKNWQNPNGYFENDSLTEFHEKLLAYNDSSWNNITKVKMNYTPAHVKEYKELIEKEFNNEKLILIKDPRLTFFVDFLKEVFDYNYECYYLFLTRNKEEACKSISLAQHMAIEKSIKLYDLTHKYYNDSFLKIDHKDIINDNNNLLYNISKYCNFNILNHTQNLVDYNLYRNRKTI